MITRRRLAMVAAGSALACVGAGSASAQSWPAKFVRLVVPFAAGGANDPIARIVTARFSEIWGQQVVIENKPGAGGNIGTEMVARSEPDGHTILLLGTVPFVVNQFLYRTVNYDPFADFAPVARICLSPNIMVVPNSSPATSVSEFIAHAKANRGRINFASSGTGTTVHLAGELFKRMAGIEMTHVPYRGGAPAMTDTIAGRIDVMFAVGGVALPQVRAGTVRALAVTTAEPLPMAPDLVTVAQAGVPGFEVAAPFALVVPARTPLEIVKKIAADAVSVLAEPAIRPKFEQLGFVVASSTPAQLTAHLKFEAERWGALIKEAGIRAPD